MGVALAWLALCPVLLLLIGFSAISLGLRRARDVGLPAALGVLPTLLCLGDYRNFFLFALGLRNSAFAKDAGFSLPLFISAGLAGAWALCIPKSDSNGGR